VLLIWPSFGMNEMGTVHFNPSPPLRGQTITIAKVLGGAFSNVNKRQSLTPVGAR
jgi:hypothetical protein